MFHTSTILAALALAACVCMSLQQLQVSSLVAGKDGEASRVNSTLVPTARSGAQLENTSTAPSEHTSTAPSEHASTAPSKESSAALSTVSNSGPSVNNSTSSSTNHDTNLYTTKVSITEKRQNSPKSPVIATDAPLEHAVMTDSSSFNNNLTLQGQNNVKQREPWSATTSLGQDSTSSHLEYNTTGINENSLYQTSTGVSDKSDLLNSSVNSACDDKNIANDEIPGNDPDLSLPNLDEQNNLGKFGSENSQDNATSSDDKRDSGKIDEVTVKLGGQQFVVCKPNMCGNRCAHGELYNDVGGQSSGQGSVQKNDSQTSETSNMPVNHVAMETSDVYSDGLDEQLTENSSYTNTYSQEMEAFTDSGKDVDQEEQQGTKWTRPRYNYNKTYGKTRNSWRHRHGKNVERRDNDSNIATDCPRLDHQPICFCDEACVLHGDCCVDVFESCFGLNGTADVLEFISDIRALYSGSIFSDDDRTSLVPERSVKNISLDLSTCEYVSVGHPVLLFRECPDDNLDSSLEEKCKNSSFHLPPVSVAFPNGGVTFRNVFCAQCHGVKHSDMTAWSTKITCDPEARVGRDNQTLNMSTLTELLNQGRCVKVFSPPLKLCPRQCDPRSRLDWQQKQQLALNVQRGVCSDADALLCQAYFYAIDGFKNVHCYKCLDYKSWQIRKDSFKMACSDDTLAEIKHPAVSNPAVGGGGGILIILDITGTYSQGGGQSETSYICEDAEVFDPLTYTCRTLVCPPGSTPYRGRCEESSETHLFDGESQIFPGGWNSLVLRIILDGDVEACEVSMAVFNMTSFSNRAGYGSSSSEQIDLNQYNSSLIWSGYCQEFRVAEGSKFEYQVTQFLIRTLESGMDIVGDFAETTNQMMSLNLENGPYKLLVSNKMNSTSPWPSCPDSSTPNLLQHFSMVTNSSSVYVLANTSSHEVYFPFRNIGFEFSVSCCSAKEGNFTLTQTVAVCDVNGPSFRANCSIVQYRLNETVQNGSRLTVIASQQHYNIGDFQVQRDVVFVCSDFKNVAITSGIERSLPYIVLSWVFTLLSTIFLLLMLVLYCLFPELCTLPGKMTASLAATMMLTFLSNSFTLLDLHHEYVCPVFAALSHVVTLAQYGWMSAIAVNMASTFGPLANTFVKSQSDRTVFRRYSLVVWGVSLALVMTSVTLDLTHDDPPTNSESATTPVQSSNYPRYGYPFCTWFSGPLWTRLAFIIIPYFITFIVSLVGFILTLVGIQQASKNSAKLGKSTSEKARCLIYIKLSSAMGFSWIISVVVSIYPDTEVLPYIYVCLVLLQGVLLFLSFMVNHRVYSLVLKRFKGSSDQLSKSGSTQNSMVMSRSL